MLLNRAAPFKQTLHFLPAIQHLVLPEPFEVPVYVGMMILFAIVIAVRVRRKKTKIWENAYVPHRYIIAHAVYEYRDIPNGTGRFRK